MCAVFRSHFGFRLSEELPSKSLTACCGIALWWSWTVQFRSCVTLSCLIPRKFQCKSPLCTVCRKGEVRPKKKADKMVCCGTCWEWYHRECVGIRDGDNVSREAWACEWCQDQPDSLGNQRWRTGRKKPKLRHVDERPKVLGITWHQTRTRATTSVVCTA